MTNYKNGSNFEYQVRDYYKRKGFYVVRSAGSHSSVDLVAFNEWRTILIQCKQEKKKTSYTSDVVELLAVPCSINHYKQFWIKKKNKCVEVTTWPGEITETISLKELRNG